jgi:hypothetical protein
LPLLVAWAKPRLCCEHGSLDVMMRSLLTLLGAAILMPATAQAQSATIPITFNGTVSTSFGDTVKIKQPDGSYATYTGPLPSFAYQDGQAVSISFNATVPDAAYYAANPSAAMMTRAADGQYRITLMPDGTGLSGLGIPGIGTASSVSVSGGITATPNPRSGGGSTLAMTLVYNATTDTYTIAPGSALVAGYFAGPGFVYDGATGTLESCTGAACDPAGTGANLFSLVGNSAGTQVSAFNIPILNSITGALAGLYSIMFSGNWTLGAGAGGATPVPEPSMMGLFGAGILVPVLRRRRARAGKVALLSRQSV